MRMTKLFGRTLRETPKDAEIPSHIFLQRAGMTRMYTAGVYALMPLANRAIAKIEKIVREEMDRVGGQEIRMTCMAPREIWEESGRYQAIGKDMFRLKDRWEHDMVLNMTHEEPVVFLARTELTSYKQLPVMVYQIANKFRDEPRPRGGLIRGREFIMKDAYSFHTSEEDLKQYYMQVHEAYARVFRRAGLKNVVSVESDNGMFGGRFSHEFQLLVPTGEDKLITCTICDYKANTEIGTTGPLPLAKRPEAALKMIPTPGAKTIAELCTFLKITPDRCIKAVLFESIGKDPKPVVVFIRGDLEVVDKKVQGLVRLAIQPAQPAMIAKAGAVAGATGPKGLREGTVVVVDRSVTEMTDAVTGANEADAHYTGFSMKRDAAVTDAIIGDIAAARPGDPCSACGSPLQESRGIEVGNIFHLGTKYTESMKCTFLDQNGKAHPQIMGCYGIGITRMLSAVIEESHDDKGVIFPQSIAPYDVHLCALNRREDAVLKASEKLYEDFIEAGVSVLFDDRDEKAGVQFADADLMGMPLRITVSPRTLSDAAGPSVEVKWRDGRAAVPNLELGSAVAKIRQMAGD